MKTYQLLAGYCLTLISVCFMPQAWAENPKPKCPSLAVIQGTSWLENELIEIEPQHMECGASGHCWPVQGRWELRANRKFDTENNWNFSLFELRANNTQQAMAVVTLRMTELFPPLEPEYDRMGYWFCSYGPHVAATTPGW
jgi:hypothetical protein